MKKRVLIAIIVVLALTATASVVWAAGGSWGLFGGASWVPGDPGEYKVGLVSDTNTFGDGDDYSGVYYKPQEPLTFSDIYYLGTWYDITDDDCLGGSPRFQLNMDTDGDGDFDGNIFVYIGPYPNFTGCSSNWQDTGNLIEATDARYDTSQLPGGFFYDTYASALTKYGSYRVLGVQLVVDSGWAFFDNEQTIDVDDTRLNQHMLTRGR